MIGGPVRGDGQQAREALSDLRNVVIEQNCRGASWHPEVFGALMSALAKSNEALSADSDKRGEQAMNYIKGESYVQVSRVDFGRWINIDLAFRDDLGLHVARSLNMETIPPEEDGIRYDGPTFKMDKEAAQRLFDELWRAGFRPHGNSEDSSRHLADMRKIAFGLLREKGVDVVEAK